LDYTIEKTTIHLLLPLFELYKDVAEKSGGIIRRYDEISIAYIKDSLSNSLESGISLVAVAGDKQIWGEIHAYQTGLKAFGHILENLTIVVAPHAQSKGIGKALFIAFLEEVKHNFNHILKVQLYVREKNTKAVQFYESLGFRIEGKLIDQILNANGSLETPLVMAWFNPHWEQI
jgi:ribosomal protein S18 acetylase RimI-like enzyme